ncbi:MAG: hypothetical protein M1825_005187 [Sarcosagium campestre]|nr:MAG: hypothetical protein M1825_005187 [Sarcosagium campestre]
MFLRTALLLAYLPCWSLASSPQLSLLDISDTEFKGDYKILPLDEDSKTRTTKGEAKRDLVLESRQSTFQCFDAGYSRCGTSYRCCPSTGKCCDNGYCAYAGGECCSTGYGSCDSGTFCCGNGYCAPDGGECCRGGGTCSSGDKCVIRNGVRGCCPNGDCSLSSLYSYSYSYSYTYGLSYSLTRTTETSTSTATDESSAFIFGSDSDSDSDSTSGATPGSTPLFGAGPALDLGCALILRSTTTDFAASSVYEVKTDCSCRSSTDTRSTVSSTGYTCTFAASPLSADSSATASLTLDAGAATNTGIAGGAPASMASQTGGDRTFVALLLASAIGAAVLVGFL